jgi:hypothetical protein
VNNFYEKAIYKPENNFAAIPTVPKVGYPANRSVKEPPRFPGAALPCFCQKAPFPEKIIKKVI